MAELLLGQPVADCGSEDERHPLVLGHAGLIGFPLDQGDHVAGDAQGLDGSLCFLGHGGDDSACDGTNCAIVYAINKQGSRRANVQPSYSRRYIR
jgi:hypothetical protein